MNSKERREGRYQRRKAKRKKPGHGIRFEDVYTMQSLQKAANDCKHGVMWKQDPINYIAHAPVNGKRAKDMLMSGSAPPGKQIRAASIHERGKERHIRMVSFKDRVQQRCLCDNALLPGLLPGLIYDNCASQKGKGVSFARERVTRHLTKAIREHGVDGTYVMLLDLKSFFDSISHRLCLNVLSKAFEDRRVVGLTMHCIKMYHKPDIEAIEDPAERKEYEERLKRNQGVGCTLGSEVSQVMAIATPSALDHMVKDECGIKHYVRYMDDMLLVGSKEELERMYVRIKGKCQELGFEINESKTKICKAKKGFTFLKIRYFVTESGKVVRRITKDRAVRQRRKLRRFCRLVDAGRMSKDDVFQSMQSWLGHGKGVKSWRAKKNMAKRYRELFGGYRHAELAL